MIFNLLTLFPDSVKPYLQSSILARATQANLIEFNLINIRDYATDKHKTVDGTPYGGGAGMVLKIEPIHKALQSISPLPKTIVLSPRGQQFTQTKAQEYSQLNSLTLIAGRYEGIDQRVIDHLADEEVSVGPYVLAGGELPALTIIEATARLVPGVLGNKESLKDSDVGGGSAQYTKPEVYNNWAVPKILLSGHHQAIKKWRQGDKNSKK